MVCLKLSLSKDTELVNFGYLAIAQFFTSYVDMFFPIECPDIWDFSSTFPEEAQYDINVWL